MPRIRRSPLIILATALVLSGAGCLAPFRSATPAPLPSMVVAKAAAESPCTALLLPGTWDRPRDFVRHGFGDLALAHKAPVDLVAVDAHVGYYRKRSIVERLHADHVAPLRARGERVWLVGVSLGGIGSLLYAAEHEEEIEGLILVAPFLGDEDVLAEIRTAGGPLAWRPTAIAGDDWQRRVWAFLQRWHGQSGPKPAIHVLYGREDDFAGGIRMLAELLPAENLREMPGGHDWKTWKSLWDDVLARGVFAGCQ